jgi:hypothetical protein
MPYVYRDENGVVQAVYAEPVDGCDEVADDDPDLTDFLQRNVSSFVVMDEWMQSDIALARVLEDLIHVLMEKKVILFTDFPEGAQQKLRERQGLRNQVTYVEQLFGGDDDDDYNRGGGGFL